MMVVGSWHHIAIGVVAWTPFGPGAARYER